MAKPQNPKEPKEPKPKFYTIKQIEGGYTVIQFDPATNTSREVGTTDIFVLCAALVQNLIKKDLGI